MPVISLENICVCLRLALPIRKFICLSEAGSCWTFGDREQRWVLSFNSEYKNVKTTVVVASLLALNERMLNYNLTDKGLPYQVRTSSLGKT